MISPQESCSNSLKLFTLAPDQVAIVNVVLVYRLLMLGAVLVTAPVEKCAVGSDL